MHATSAQVGSNALVSDADWSATGPHFGSSDHPSTVASMASNDRDVLEFIGRQGKTPEQLAERFPDFDIDRLVRAGLARLQRIELRETIAPGSAPAPDPTFYALTPRGAEAIGIDPRTLHAA